MIDWKTWNIIYLFSFLMLFLDIFESNLYLIHHLMINSLVTKFINFSIVMAIDLTEYCTFNKFPLNIYFYD